MDNPFQKLKNEIVQWVEEGEAKLENKIKYEVAQRAAQIAIADMMALRPQNADKGLSQALELTKVD